MAGLNDRAQQAAYPNPVRAHLNRNLGPVGGHNRGPHRFGILGAEIEDLPHLDPPRDLAALFGNGVEQRRVVGLIGARIKRGEFLADRRHLVAIVVIHLAVAQFQLGHGTVKEHLRLTGRGQHEEFMRVIAANWARIRPHRNGGQTHPLIGPQIADHMAVIGMQRARLVDVKVIAVLHQELAPPHHAKARTHLVAELPLDVV